MSNHDCTAYNPYDLNVEFMDRHDYDGLPVTVEVDDRATVALELLRTWARVRELPAAARRSVRNRACGYLVEAFGMTTGLRFQRAIVLMDELAGEPEDVQRARLDEAVRGVMPVRRQLARWEAA